MTPTINAAAAQGFRSVNISAVVIRCGCDADQKSLASWHGHHGQPCPFGRNEDLGTVASWHRNPFVRLYRRVKSIILSRSHA